MKTFTKITQEHRRYFTIALTISLTICCFFSVGFSQSIDTTYYKRLKTKKFYSANFYSQSGYGIETIYKINGEFVNKRTFKKYKKKWKNMENCCPCILETFDINETLLTKGVSCTDCGVGWFNSYYPNGKIKISGGYKENPTDDWENIWYRGYCSVKNGQWTYFNNNGDTLYNEFWKNGEFIKQIPEQDSAEIWDIELFNNGQIVDTQFIEINQIPKLEIFLKYKNSKTISDLTIEFEVSAIGHKQSIKKFTIDSFKEINVNEMLEEVGIPKEKSTSFELSVFNKEQVIKRFYLNVKK